VANKIRNKHRNVSVLAGVGHFLTVELAEPFLYSPVTDRHSPKSQGATGRVALVFGLSSISDL